MYSLLFLGTISFVCSLILTPLVRNLLRRCGMLDRPDSDRKRHGQPVPKGGGIPLAISLAISFGLLLLTKFGGAEYVQAGLPLALRILPAVCVVLVTGILDDIAGLMPSEKLFGQLTAAAAAYSGGVVITGIAGHEFQPWLSLLLTVGWLVLCTNAINLIDGVDGLAAGVGLFASATTLIAALFQKNFGLAAATMPLVGALLGFLRYNFNPATVFLGDSGSLLVGFLLGSYGIWWSQKSATIVGMTAPLMALAIPLLDTAVAIVRRFLRRQPIFGPDRGHIHHRLLDRGFTPRKVVLILYSLCGIVGIFSLCITNRQFEGLVLVVFCGAAWIGIQHLGYVELGVAGRMFIEGAFRRQLSAQIALEHYEDLLDGATDLPQCWAVLERAAREFGFRSARLLLPGRSFHFGPETAAGTAWQIVVPLEDFGSIELWRALGDTWPSAVVAPFIEMVSGSLAPRLPMLTNSRHARPLNRAPEASAGQERREQLIEVPASENFSF